MQLMVPFTQSLWQLLTVYFAMGLLIGTYDTATQTFLSTLWGAEGLPFRQSVMLVRGAGSALGPLIVQPFLMRNSPAGDKSQDQVSLVWPFSIFAILCLASALLSLAVWHIMPETVDHPSRVTVKSSNDGNEASSHRQTNKLWMHVMTCLCILFIFFDTAIDVSLRSFIAPFITYSKLNLGQDTGAALTTGFFAAATVTRFAGLFYIQWIGIEINYLISMMLLMVANAILLIYCESSAILLWIGVCMAGISTASNIPCMYGYMEKHFAITHITASVVGVFYQLSYIVFPLIVSHFMQIFPASLFWTVLVCSCCLCLLLPAIVLIAKNRLPAERKELCHVRHS
jgi:MFS family permease